MGKKDRIEYLAYVGTTKVACLKARVVRNERPEVLALSARLADGFERGIVKDLARASETLAQTVSDVIGTDEKAIVPCRLVVSSTYLKSYTYQSSIYFQANPHPVTLRDIRLAIAQTRSVATIPLQEVIVQAVPQEFLVNDLAGVQNPIGLEASRLGVTLRLLTLDVLVYNNLMRVFERCDLEVTEVIPTVLAAAHGVLTASEKQSGVLMVVMGGAATQFACFKNSVLVETRSIPLGSDCITEAIEKKLNLEHLDAQRVKESFGSAVPRTEFGEELIPIPESNGRKKFPIKRSEFETQMNAGLQQLFEGIRKEIQEFQKSFSPLTHVVFTGGGTRLDGFLDVMRDSVSPTARIGTTQGLTGPEALLVNPAFSGVLGGITYTSKISDHGMYRLNDQHWISRSLERAREWIFEYL